MSLSRQQFTLLGIFTLFMGPVLLVILMRSSMWQYQPDGLKNLGHLIQPPVSLPMDHAQSIDGKWLILYVLDQTCDQKCIESVTTLRQIHRAAGRNGEHLAVVLFSEVPVDSVLRNRLEAIYPGFEIITDSSNQALNTLTTINSDIRLENVDSNSIRTYILDPMLNVILAYGAEANPNDLHKDLKRLLKWADKERR
jgi:cytochrome oxidase Cu insertion factor (SCO1/SenC/PrrC family)